MLKKLMLAGTFCAAACSTHSGLAQRAKTLPAGSPPGYVQAGIGGTYGHTDYGQKSIKGLSGFIDYNFAQHFGVEADIHYIALVTPEDLAENSYVAGPRIMYSFGRFTPYGKVVAGLGSLVIQEFEDNHGKGNGSYLIYGAGGGVDVTVTNHIVVRAFDFEYQEWPGLGNGLTPYNVTIGVAYRFH